MGVLLPSAAVLRVGEATLAFQVHLERTGPCAQGIVWP